MTGIPASRVLFFGKSKQTLRHRLRRIGFTGFHRYHLRIYVPGKNSPLENFSYLVNLDLESLNLNKRLIDAIKNGMIREFVFLALGDRQGRVGTASFRQILNKKVENFFPL